MKKMSYKNVCLIFIILVFFSFIEDDSDEAEKPQNDNPTWISKLSIGDGRNIGQSVLMTNEGGYIIAGTYNSGYKRICIIKSNSMGEKLSSICSDTGEGKSIQQTHDGGYIVTGISLGDSYFHDNNSVFVQKIESPNNWKKNLVSSFGGSEGSSIKQTHDGGYIITGSVTITIAPDSLNGEAYLIKTGPSGNIIWEGKFGGSGSDCARNVVQTTDGNYILVGDTKSYGDRYGDVYIVRADSSGNELWHKTYGGSGELDWGNVIEPASGGGFIIVGTTFSFGNGSCDIYLIKVDSSGNQLWFKTFGGKEADYGRSVKPTLDGGYIIVGDTQSYGPNDYGTCNVYLIKTDSQGNELWHRTYGYKYDDIGFDVQQTDDGGFIITGFSSNDDSNSKSEIILIKTNSEGL